MIRVEELFSVVIFGLWIFCVVDAIQTPEAAMRNLPKTVWLIVVLLFPFVGSIAWLVAGRPEHAPRRLSAHERAQPAFPEYDRPGRAASVDPARDEEFLAQVRARAAAQRKSYDEKQRREREGGSGPQA